MLAMRMRDEVTRANEVDHRNHRYGETGTRSGRANESFMAQISAGLLH